MAIFHADPRNTNRHYSINGWYVSLRPLLKRKCFTDKCKPSSCQQRVELVIELFCVLEYGVQGHTLVVYQYSIGSKVATVPLSIAPTGIKGKFWATKQHLTAAAFLINCYWTHIGQAICLPLILIPRQNLILSLLRRLKSIIISFYSENDENVKYNISSIGKLHSTEITYKSVEMYKKG